ncbi:MAG: DMT family transporter [Lentisphaeria bacterium]|nr:DMT family transporter [Lentisphaeria bacterium]
MKNVWGSVAMITATILWGVAFSAQSCGMKFVDPMLFTSLRSLVGVAALLVVIMIFDLIKDKHLSIWGKAVSAAEKKALLTGGLWCGVIISAASITQQYSLKYISAGKTGFLTALYIIIVPVMGIFLKRKTTPVLWLAVIIAMTGTYLLCGGIESIGKGEIFAIICSVIYSMHILVIDRYAAQCDCVRLSCIQFITATFLAAAASRISGEAWVTDDIAGAMPFWIFCGVGSSAIAFTLQMVAQKYLHPVTATLLMSLESVFGVLGGAIFLHERLSLQEITGCAIIFAAIILAQLPLHGKKSLT